MIQTTSLISPPTHDRVRELLDYDPATGLFKWLVRRGRIRAGSIAGSKSKVTGYIEIRIDFYLVLGHRLAHFWMTGEWPSDEVDHKNKNKSDNSWDNLRPASRSQNGVNKGANRNNMLGIKGVRRSRSGNKFHARIWNKTGDKWIGSFDSEEEANEAYIAEARKQHGEFSYA